MIVAYFFWATVYIGRNHLVLVDKTDVFVRVELLHYNDPVAERQRVDSTDEAELM